MLAALPAALRGNGHSVSVVLPLYRQLHASLEGLQHTKLAVEVELGEQTLTARIWQAVSRDGVTVFAIERDEFFDRGNLYGANGEDYFDNAARFIFFSKAVVALAENLDPRPEILHANDWQAALIPLIVKSEQLPFKTVLTIHNLAYQGVFPARDFTLTNLPGFYLKPHALEYYGQMNLLKGGILFADAVTTVSPGYAKEILTEQHGCGLDGALMTRREALTGILNGIDAELWNPAKDKWIAAQYDARHLPAKEKNKDALLKFFKLSIGRQPLFGVISRLVEQKGIELILSVAPEILQQGAGLVVLGSGDAQYEAEFKKLAQQYPKQVAVSIGFDEQLAHRIEAGCDIFLMPSRFEPCGLNQFYSMRYGTIPVVHDIGGLGDSVRDGETGLKFRDFNTESFGKAVNTALKLFGDRKKWPVLQIRTMQQDFSWQRRVPEYEKIYQSLV